MIQLSSTSGPVKTSDMTQQQKVAAALMKAGISNPAAWSAAGLPSAGGTSGGVQVMADPAANGSGTNGNGSHGDSNPAENSFDPHPPVVLMKGKRTKPS